MIRTIPVKDITVDLDCQPRLTIDTHIVTDYADDMAGGAEFPPLTVYQDDATHWLADGFHRLAAVLSLGLAEVRCDVRPGGKRDAILFAVGANSVHGLRRTNVDKWRAAETLINDPEWSAWSDREIARQCGATHPFIGKVRAAASGNGYQIDRSVTRGDSTYVMKTTAQKPDAAPVQTIPSHLSSAEAAALFGEVDDADADEPIAPAVAWTTDDGKHFATIAKTMTILDADPKAVAFAAAALDPDGAARFLTHANEWVIWQSRFFHELRSLNVEIGGAR